MANCISVELSRLIKARGYAKAALNTAYLHDFLTAMALAGENSHVATVANARASAGDPQISDGARVVQSRQFGPDRKDLIFVLDWI